MDRGGKVLVAVGLPLLAASAMSGWRAYSLVATGRHTVGVVVRDYAGETGDRSPGHPLIAFTTADGRTVRAHQNSGADVRYGTRLPVVYRAADPQGAVMESFWSIWTIPLVLLWFGSFLSIGPFFGMKLERDR